jgi:hypothetical protein
VGLEFLCNPNLSGDAHCDETTIMFDKGATRFLGLSTLIIASELYFLGELSS